MLPEPLRLLMVAYATGDLSPRSRRAAERLLKHSPEARELLAGLQSDAELLGCLPVHSAPTDLKDRILRRIPGAAPVEPPVLTRPSRWPLVISTFVAASVVLSVTVVAWSMLTITRPRLPSEPLAVRQDPPSEHGDSPAFGPNRNEAEPRTTVAAAPPTVSTPLPHPAASPQTAKSDPTPATGSELASPPRDLPEPEPLVLSRLPELFAALSLTDKAVNEKLVSELAGGDAHRIDLFCRDGGKALDRLHAAMKQLGVRTLSDAVVVEMQKKRIRGTYVVYTGDLNAAEWGKVLQLVSAADRKAEEKKPGDGVFEQLVLVPLGPSDQKELQSFMGHDPLQSSTKLIEHDPKRPIADDTADEVARSIGKAAASKNARLSIAMAPVRTSPAHSSEIRQFLDSRRPHVPGNVSVMFVIRVAS